VEAGCDKKRAESTHFFAPDNLKRREREREKEREKKTKNGSASGTSDSIIFSFSPMSYWLHYTSPFPEAVILHCFMEAFKRTGEARVARCILI
jgi:hypothetical protein